MKFIYTMILAMPSKETFETTVESTEPLWTNDMGFIAIHQGHGKQVTFNPAYIMQMDVQHVEG